MPGMESLQGIRVLDFTRVLAGPYATRMLADFGAEVIKVQSAKTAQGAEANGAPYFNMYNRNKKSITLDMAQPRARELALALVARCDVVAENFSPRVLANWDLIYPVLCQARPDLILLRMSGLGQSGPWRDVPAFGPTIQSLAGFTALTAYPGEPPPLGLGFSYADVASGLYGALAVLAALELRRQTGRGQCIDLSECEAVATLLGEEFLAAQGHPEPAEVESPAPNGCYPCAGQDRWCALAVFDDAQWRALCQALHLPDLAADQRFATNAGRRQHAADLDRALARATAAWPAEDLAGALQAAGVCAGTVQDARGLGRDPQLRARSFLRPLPGPSSQITDNTPLRFAGASPAPWQEAPYLGQHNAEVFGGLLGLSEAEIAELVEQGVIA